VSEQSQPHRLHNYGEGGGRGTAAVPLARQHWQDSLKKKKKTNSSGEEADITTDPTDKCWTQEDMTMTFR
jgi:hypothetical protein